MFGVFFYLFFKPLALFDERVVTCRRPCRSPQRPTSDGSQRPSKDWEVSFVNWERSAVVDWSWPDSSDLGQIDLISLCVQDGK